MSEDKIFYVCSYGGSGSWMLCDALAKYGLIRHIHSRNPPNKLTYHGHYYEGNSYEEWFNNITNPEDKLKDWYTYVEWFNNIPISEDKLKKYYVIYIYRNPSFAIPSRFYMPEHLEHIQIDKNIKLEDVLTTGEDLYKIREFYDNYIKPNEKRNYKIYCVKYEDIFDKQDELSNLLEIGKLNIVNKSDRKDSNKELDKIYADLIEEMNKNDFIIIS